MKKSSRKELLIPNLITFRCASCIYDGFPKDLRPEKHNPLAHGAARAAGRKLLFHLREFAFVMKKIAHFSLHP